ncbi:hypothetical protein [Paractinoplanes rishiriensis]|uniref:Uncharacterized protein n=1 Tax=Paractinoplanes rishiriensis TaxID=1050105 RepID=A0A919MVJ0_9ACTN|nr:hypothetical protein [Actinoplanes rishiriensis]GIF01467.1 hypothetical protein Ari01nite_89310 [Actinoplanes rishiriensis]
MTQPRDNVEPALLAASLRCAVDLGRVAPVNAVARQSAALASLWRYTLMTISIAATQADMEREHGKTRIERVDGGSAINIVVISSGLRFYHGVGSVENDRRAEETPLLVRSMSLHSPWEMAMTTLAQTSTPAMYGLAALVSLERIMKMIREFQSHRQDMLDRQVRRELLRRASASPALSGGDLLPPAELDAAEDSVEQLGRYPILRVDVTNDG